ELDRHLLQDLVVDRLPDGLLVLVDERLHPARAVAHPERGRIDVDPEAALREIGADLERRAPARDLDAQVVRGPGRGTPPPRLDPEGAVLRPEGVRASRDLHAEL